MIDVFEIQDETNLNIKHCVMLTTHHWIDMHIVMGRESVNAKLYFKFSTLKNNKEMPGYISMTYLKISSVQLL